MSPPLPLGCCGPKKPQHSLAAAAARNQPEPLQTLFSWLEGENAPMAQPGAFCLDFEHAQKRRCRRLFEKRRWFLNDHHCFTTASLMLHMMTDLHGSNFFPTFHCLFGIRAPGARFWRGGLPLPLVYCAHRETRSSTNRTPGKKMRNVAQRGSLTHSWSSSS